MHRRHKCCHIELAGARQPDAIIDAFMLLHSCVHTAAYDVWLLVHHMLGSSQVHQPNNQKSSCKQPFRQQNNMLAGEDQEKHNLNTALEEVFVACKQHYLSNPSMTGAEFFEYVRK